VTIDVMAAQRQLIIMRHAKAGELPGGPDIERELRPRGRRNAESAGAWLAGRQLLPDLVLCSKARRARQTWQYVSEGLRAKPEVVVDPRLYDAGAEQLLAIFGETEPQVTTVMYVGHNPAAAEVTDILIDEPIPFPTAAIAVIGLSSAWTDLETGTGELIASWTPKALA
jgi:phosphohistidine phosphatase